MHAIRMDGFEQNNLRINRSTEESFECIFQLLIYCLYKLIMYKMYCAEVQVSL